MESEDVLLEEGEQRMGVSPSELDDSQAFNLDVAQFSSTRERERERSQSMPLLHSHQQEPIHSYHASMLTCPSSSFPLPSHEDGSDDDLDDETTDPLLASLVQYSRQLFPSNSDSPKPACKLEHAISSILSFLGHSDCVLTVFGSKNEIEC
jgi:hypothetical protein